LVQNPGITTTGGGGGGVAIVN